MTEIKATTFTVYPDGYDAEWLPSDKFMWTLTVEYCGESGYPGTDPARRWAVRRMGSAWTTSGEWEYEPQPSSRDAAWFNQARFTLEDARGIAEGQLPLLSINGRTFREVSDEWRHRARSEPQA